jgi:6-pyruvoyltetrahydropterin/6-carboxytetrahydropterin synthase
MSYELTVTTHFAAAHQLKMVAAKCENLHGHNWRVEVRLQGEKLNAAGVLMDFGEIKTHLAAVIAGLDHRFLNTQPPFGDEFPPSSEHIARYIAEQLQRSIQEPGVRVSQVTAWESENASATYRADEA